MLDSPYDKFKNELKFFNLANMIQIENMAASMTEDEIMQFFMPEDDDVTKGDKRIFTKAYFRGRAKGIAAASVNLFATMKDSKSGAAACLSYLKRHADNYSGEVDDSEAKEGFVYNVSITASDKGNEIQEAKEAADKKVVSLKSV